MTIEEKKQEFERKFLVRGDEYRSRGREIHLQQGYLSTDKDRTVRVRVEGDNKGLITIKGRSTGELQPEYEYEIPVEDAKQIIASLCGGKVIDKIRYAITVNGFDWVVDEFKGLNESLVIAEIEAVSEEELGRAIQSKPDWAAKDVTMDFKYRNSNLLNYPFSKWAQEERAEVTQQ